jgi:hypothetical protein
LIRIPAACDRFDQTDGSIEAASPKIDLVPFVLQASQTQRFEILMGSAECMNARATFAPAYQAVTLERNTKIGLADAWRFLNETAVPLKLGWAL